MWPLMQRVIALYKTVTLYVAIGLGAFLFSFVYLTVIGVYRVTRAISGSLRNGRSKQKQTYWELPAPISAKALTKPF